jgi:hypothetical protein
MIERMLELIGDLRSELDDFDLEVHDDDGNSDLIEAAYSELSDLQATIESMVP